ncbi:MAG: hypothetical protein ACI8ZM_001743 [Crocinitomix sp.]|jgi:hypothetical protein
MEKAQKLISLRFGLNAWATNIPVDLQSWRGHQRIKNLAHNARLFMSLDRIEFIPKSSKVKLCIFKKLNFSV